MNKLTITFFSFLLYSFMVMGNNDLMRGHIKGKVKTISYNYYAVELKFGEVQDTIMTVKYLFKYDEAGNCTEAYSFMPNGKLDSKISFIHDDKGNVIEEVHNDPESILIIKCTYKNDNKGNHTEGESYTPGGLLNRSVFTYDEKGNQVEWSEYKPDGGLDKRYKDKYDVNGNCVDQKEYNQDGRLDAVYTYKYANYDVKGNWQKSITIRFDEVTSITERKIEYY